MNEMDGSTLALKISEAILLYRGQISLEDIKAMPFLGDDRNVEVIANHLKAKFSTRSHIECGQKGNLADWEELIVLNRV